MNTKGGRCAAEPYSKTAKTHLNLFYYRSCGYDVDNDGWSFLYKKEDHVPNIPRYESHEYYGVSMKSQHKWLPNVSGMGKGFKIYLNQQKAAYNAGKSTNKRRVGNRSVVNIGMVKRNIGMVDISSNGRNRRESGSIIGGKHES